MELLENEVALNLMLDHPNIVKFEEAVEDKKYFMIFMELMEGGDVSSNHLF